MRRAVSRDLELGLEMSNDVRSAIQICASRVSEVRSMAEKVCQCAQVTYIVLPIGSVKAWIVMYEGKECVSLCVCFVPRIFF
jgi:hypothetical protein